jgi:hypothetical protein
MKYWIKDNLPLLFVTSTVIFFVTIAYFAITTQQQRAEDVSQYCYSKGLKPGDYTISKGKYSDTVRFCVGADGVMYWPYPQE